MAIVVLLAVGGWWAIGRSHSAGAIPEPTSTSIPSTTEPATPQKVEVPESKPSKSEEKAKAKAEAKAAAEAEAEREAKAEERAAKAEEKDAAQAQAKAAAAAQSKSAKVVKEVKPPPPPPPPEPDPADKKVEKIFVTSRPSGAKVVLDGRSVGKTPVEVEVRGKAHVSLSLDGYNTLEKDLRLADVHGTVNLELQATSGGGSSSTGKFFLSSAPAGAEILYQGKVIGKTPKMVELPAGNRTLILRSGALSHTVDLDVKEGQNPAQHVPL